MMRPADDLPAVYPCRDIVDFRKGINGEVHECIYDIAVSDDREIASDGRARKDVGNSLDIESATYTNTTGDAMIVAHWADPDFDPQEPAFYYVRVLDFPARPI